MNANGFHSSLLLPYVYLSLMGSDFFWYMKHIADVTHLLGENITSFIQFKDVTHVAYTNTSLNHLN